MEDTFAMDAALLRTILEHAPGFKADGATFSLAEGFEATLTLAIDATEAQIEKVRTVRVEHGFVAVVSGEKGTTTYADASAVATLAVREESRGDKKRPGFA